MQEYACTHNALILITITMLATTDTTVEGKVCSLSDQDETKLGKGSSRE